MRVTRRRHSQSRDSLHRRTVATFKVCNLERVSEKNIPLRLRSLKLDFVFIRIIFSADCRARNKLDFHIELRQENHCPQLGVN